MRYTTSQKALAMGIWYEGFTEKGEAMKLAQGLKPEPERFSPQSHPDISFEVYNLQVIGGRNILGIRQVDENLRYGE